MRSKKKVYEGQYKMNPYDNGEKLAPDGGNE